MKPIYIHSGMVGAPQYADANDNINSILEACLVNGFNSRTATSASAAGGVLTLNYASNPGFEALQTVELALADVALVNGQHRVVANANNQVTIAIAGLPDGAVGSTGAGITIKQAGAGWSKPFSASTKAVFRPAAGNRRFLRVVNAAGANTQVRGYEDMTDVDTGTGPFPTVAQVATPIGLSNTSWAVANSAWFAVATNKWMFFTLATSAAGTSPGTGMWFGDCAHATVPSDAYSSVIRLDVGLSYLCRNYAGAVGAIAASERLSDGSSADYPSVLSDGTQFVPYAPLLESSSNILRGMIPNSYKCYPHLAASQFSQVYSNVAGVTGRIKPMFTATTGAMHFAIAIDEEAWD